ncbi:MAG: uroporphyrinogen decarboxylase [Puniceicoccaceae bacterium]
MNSRQRFTKALEAQPVDRPPVWFMRQAGRYLPEYRSLKTRHDFRTLVKTPELAAEVTLQPLRRFPLDAAILFSDILTVPEALGFPYRFRDQGGIEMERTFQGHQDLPDSSIDEVIENLAYVPDALRLLRQSLGDHTALLGFAGSPWTLAAYMIEGGSPEPFLNAKALFYQNRQVFDQLLDKITEAVTAYLISQANAGADALQIFDSWACGCPATEYHAMSLRWIEQIVKTLRARNIPVLIYARGAAGSLSSLAATRPTGLSLDATVDLKKISQKVDSHLVLQGNLDPIVPTLDPEIAVRCTENLLSEIGSRPGYIFNTGHGVTPHTKIETLAAIVEAVATFKPKAAHLQT